MSDTDTAALGHAILAQDGKVSHAYRGNQTWLPLP